MSITKFVRWKLGVLFLISAAVAACGSPEPTATPSPSPTAARQEPTAAAPTSVAPRPTATVAAPQVPEEARLAGVIPVPDFYETYWPKINASLDQLHRKALADEGGEVSLWGFNEIDPLTQAAFTKRFPGMKITTQGRQFATAGAIITASAAGQFTTDTFGGAYNIYEPLWAKDLMDQTFDWTQFGVPKEFIDPKRPGMMFDSSNSFVIWFNTNLLKSDEIPDDPFEFAKPEWKGKIASNPSYFFAGFSYIALKFGEQRARDLAITLLDQQGLLITSDPESLIVRGDRSVMFPTFNIMDEWRKGAPVDVKSYQGAGVWAQMAGVLKNAKHPNGGALYELWSAWDPDFLKQQYEDTNFTMPSPHLGLPRDTIAPNKKMLVSLDALEKGWPTFLTVERLPERVKLLDMFQRIVTQGER